MPGKVAGAFALTALLAAGLAPPTHAGGLRCAKLAGCTDTALLEELRAAAEAACPCDEAASTKEYGACWKAFLKEQSAALGDGLPKECRKALTSALKQSTCGRPDAVLCRKPSSKGESCQVTDAARCEDPYPAGPYRSCADTCDAVTALPFPTTRELSAADLAALQPELGEGVLRFEPAPAGLDDVAPGLVLVGGVAANAPAGLLRLVLTVERDDEGVTLTTAQAPIQLAYRKLHVRFVRSLVVPPASTALLAKGAARLGSFPGAAAVAPAADVEASQPFDYVLFDGDGNEATLNDQVAIDGTIGGGFDFALGVDVDWGAIDSLPDIVTDCIASIIDAIGGGMLSCSIDALLPEAKVTFVVDPFVTADANAHGAAIVRFSKDIDLASQTLTPIIAGPLVFVPVADITAHVSGGASGLFSTGIHGSALFTTSVTVSSKQTQTPQFSPPVLKSTDFGPNDTEVTLHADAKVGAGARLNVLLFGVTGPYATALAYGAIDADVLDAPCWTLRAGLEADLGVKVTSPALPFVGTVTLADWKAPTLNALEVDLTSGACEVPPDSSTLPPGSGPDAERLANPTFTPWSRTYATPVDGSSAGSPGNGVVFTDLEPTIDGRLIRSGFGTLSIVKLGDEGQVIWARDLERSGSRIAPVRVRSASDGSLLAASRTLFPSLVLTRLAQDGSALGAQGYEIPFDTCTVDLTALAADATGGAWLAGGCLGAPNTFLLHAPAGGDGTLHVLGELGGFRVHVLERIGDDLFLAGRGLFEGLDKMVALRLTPEGEVVYAKLYTGCNSAPSATPADAIVGPLGEVTLTGSSGPGFVLRILPDGEVGFASFPGFGFGAGSSFALDSIAELPTTGYVVGGAAVSFTNTEPDNVPSAVLLGLDAAGQILWGKRYSFGSAGAFDTSSHLAVRLTDAGGVIATTLLEDPTDPLGGKLWAFEAAAKDGEIEFLPDAASVTPLGATDLSCSFTASDFALEVETSTIEVEDVAVTSTPATLTVEAQTAD